ADRPARSAWRPAGEPVMRAARLLLCLWMGACHRGDGGGAAQDQEMATPEQHPDEHAAMAAEHAMAGRVSNEDLHLRLTAVRPAATGDSARAAEILTIMRRELAKYRDVRVAQDDGFRNFIPTTAAPIQHFRRSAGPWNRAAGSIRLARRR